MSLPPRASGPEWPGRRAVLGDHPTSGSMPHPPGRGSLEHVPRPDPVQSPGTIAALEDSPSGLWRSLGKRVGGNPSGVRISHPPQVGTVVPEPSGRTGSTGMDAVVIDTDRVPLEALLDVARGAPVELSGAARERIAAARRVVDGVLESGRAVYGLTTGVGHARDVRVPDDQLVGQQYMIVRTHSGGIGPHLPTELARAAMAVRLIGLTRGGSGASP